MAKNRLRKIKINNETYLWKREHLHLTEYEHSKCVEKVVIYLEGYKNSPLELLFREEDNLTIKMDIEKEKWCVGYPEDGVIWLYESFSDNKANSVNIIDKQQIRAININLNRPAVIAELIKYFYQNNWKPKERTTPYIIENALKLLEIVVLPKGIN